MNKTLIISAHADDETFGMGGTLLRLSEDSDTELHWLIVTKIWQPKWSASIIQKRENAINTLCEKIDFKSVIRWDYEDNKLDTYPINDVQEDMMQLLDTLKPNTIFTPSIWDFNHDHRLVCDIVEMSAKSYYCPYVKEIIAYEIPSATEHSFKSMRNFPPNLYYNVTEYIKSKMELIRIYETELKEFPHPRSIEYVESLAKIRGGESGVHYAEAFHMFKGIR